MSGLPELTHRTDLRRGEWVGFDDETVYVDLGDDRYRMDFADVAEVSLEDYDYTMGIVSLILVGFGIYFARQHLGSLFFTAAGLVSAYRIYSRRNELAIKVTGRAKPLVCYPEDAQEFYERLGREMGTR